MKRISDVNPGIFLILFLTPSENLELLGGLVSVRFSGRFGQVVLGGFWGRWGGFRKVLGRLWEGNRLCQNQNKNAND